MVIGRLQFVRTAQSAGLAQTDIKGVLSQRDPGEAPCAHVADLLEEQLAEVWFRQRKLAALADELGRLIDVGRELDPADCSDADICQIISNPRTAQHETTTVRTAH